MAIAGGTQNCVQVWIHNGQAAIGASQRADGDKVIDDPEEAVRAVLAGQKHVYLRLRGDNVPRYRTAVAAQLGLPVFK
jgi:hypothetical protein